MKISQIEVKSLSLAIDVRLWFDSGFSLLRERENNLEAPHSFVKSERIQHRRSPPPPPPEEIPFHLFSSLLLFLPPLPTLTCSLFHSLARRSEGFV